MGLQINGQHTVGLNKLATSKFMIYKQVQATNNRMITKLVLVCTLLQLFSKHAINAESISFQVKQFVSI